MTRNTHDRLYDHFGNDLDTNIALNGDVGPINSGTSLHDALIALQSDTTGTITGVSLSGGGGPYSEPTLNFIQGTNVTITVVDNTASDRVDVTISAASGGGGGGGGWDTVTGGVALQSGRTFAYSTGQDSYVWLSESGAEISSDSAELFLGAYGSEPIVMISSAGAVFPSNNVESGTIYDTGHMYVDDRMVMDIPRLAQPDMSGLGIDVWYSLLPGSGWMPEAFPIGFVQDGTYTTVRTLAANDDTIAVPFFLTAPMDLASVSFWNTDTATARSWEVALYHQPFQNSTTNDKLLLKVDGSQNFGSITPSSAGLRGTSYSTGQCYVPAGLVWVCLKNSHNTNTLGVGYMAGSTQMPVNLAQQKTLTSTSFDGDTLDFIAATWTKLTDIHAITLRGRVFGQTTQF